MRRILHGMKKQILRRRGEKTYQVCTILSGVLWYCSSGDGWAVGEPIVMGFERHTAVEAFYFDQTTKKTTASFRVVLFSAILRL